MYSRSIKQIEDDIQDIMKKVNELTGIKESDTGLAPPALWDLTADKHTQNELTGIKESDTGLAPPALWDLTADKHTLHS